MIIATHDLQARSPRESRCRTRNSRGIYRGSPAVARIRRPLEHQSDPVREYCEYEYSCCAITPRFPTYGNVQKETITRTRFTNNHVKYYYDESMRHAHGAFAAGKSGSHECPSKAGPGSRFAAPRKLTAFNFACDRSHMAQLSRLISPSTVFWNLPFGSILCKEGDL